MHTFEEISTNQQSTWDEFSTGWEKWDQLLITEWSRVVNALDQELPAGVGSVLDIATGTGEPALTIAGNRPEARVVGADLSEGMLQVAAARARARGLQNFETRACDVCALPFADGTFDAVVSRLGLCLFPDPPRALDEMLRVTRPGGKIVAAVWGQTANNAWLTIADTAIRQTLGLPPPPPDAPGVFRFNAEGTLPRALSDAGLLDVTAREVFGEMEFQSADDYLEMMFDMIAPVTGVVRQVDAPSQERARQAILSAARAQATPEGHLRMQWSSWIASGYKDPGTTRH